VKPKKGFTLIELLTVISIIAMLLAILMPAMSKAREIAKRVICAHSQKQVALGFTIYVSDSDGILPWYGGKDPLFEGKWKAATAEDDERHPCVAFRGKPGEDDNWMQDGKAVPMRLGCLFARGTIKDARVFYCPSNKEKDYVYESYVAPYPPNASHQWGTLPQRIDAEKTSGDINWWVRTGLTYYPIDLSVTRDGTAEEVPLWTARKYDKMDSRIPFLADRIWNTSANKGMEDLNHNQAKMYGLNATFKDGHVVFVKGLKTQGDKGPFDEDVWTEFSRMPTSDAYRKFYYMIFTAIQP
jgi:prepilin-type N-terminal cleavage/methylation domain-containing protein